MTCGASKNVLGRPLTAEERRVSQRGYCLYMLVNGVSYMCLGENILVLFAARLAAPDVVVALLGTMFYVGYAMIPLGVRRTASRGCAASFADFWVARNAAALLTASAALVALVSPAASWVVLLLGSFLFYGFRAAGHMLTTPLVGEISTEEEAPTVLARSQGLFDGSAVVVLVAITLATARWNGIGALSAIIVVGALCGFWSSVFLRGVKETGAIRDAARVPFGPEVRRTFRERDLRRFAFGWSALNVFRMLSVPMSLLALKRGCGLGDSAALLCACAQFAAASAASFASGPMCRRFGPRQVMLCAAFGYLSIPLAWLAMPSGGIAAIAAGAALFALLGALNTFVFNASAAYFLLACPAKERQIGASVALNLASSAGAGIVGSALGSWFVMAASRLAPRLGSGFGGLFPDSSLGTYRLYFVLLLLPAIAGVAAAWRMRRFIYKTKRNVQGD